MSEDQRDISQLPNLGPASARMLAGAGINTIGQLRDLSPVIAYLAVKQAGDRPSINLLWAIVAGLQDRHWTDLTTTEKQHLRAQLKELTE